MTNVIKKLRRRRLAEPKGERERDKVKLEALLIDADPSFSDRQPIKVVAYQQGVVIDAKGYGDCCSADGHGSPVFLELYQGQLRLIVFADINEQDPEIINLDGAKEDRRIVT